MPPQTTPTQTPPPPQSPAPVTPQPPSPDAPTATPPPPAAQLNAPMQLNPAYTQSSKMAMASVILGVISIPGSFLTLITVAIPVIGIILGALSIKKQRGLAMTGIILSTIGIILSIGLLIFANYYKAKHPEKFQSYNTTSFSHHLHITL